MSIDQATTAKLRADFLPAFIGKLPRGEEKTGDKKSCRVCGGWHRPASTHISYVGHAAITARLLDVDPEWNWEPLAFGDDNMPRFVVDLDGHPVGLWIWLTVCGVRRLGYGSCGAGQEDPEKVLIGDALRNAAMRFGVALTLWIKGSPPTEGARGADSAPPDAGSAPDDALLRHKRLFITEALKGLDSLQLADFKAFCRLHSQTVVVERMQEVQLDRVATWLMEEGIDIGVIDLDVTGGRL